MLSNLRRNNTALPSGCFAIHLSQFDTSSSRQNNCKYGATPNNNADRCCNTQLPKVLESVPVGEGEVDLIQVTLQTAACLEVVFLV